MAACYTYFDKIWTCLENHWEVVLIVNESHGALWLFNIIRFVMKYSTYGKHSHEMHLLESKYICIVIQISMT